jgi:Uma2 family endonuclease
MTPTTLKRATLDDLARTPGKAELIDGRIVRFMPTGHEANQAAGEIFVSLKIHIRATRRGAVYTDNAGFAVPKLPSGRESFSPDAAYYDVSLPAKWKDFIPGPPTFAVEVRSKGDYGPAAERDMAAKRADYFQAGTLAVWDVDPEARVVRCYRAGDPANAATFVAGQEADAEPAVPGWRMAVDEIFA